MGAVVSKLPERFELTLRIDSPGTTEPPLVASVGWGIDMGSPEGERSIGDAVARVLKAVGALHGSGLSVDVVLAHAVRLAVEHDTPERAFYDAARAFLKTLEGE